ncbi:MAG TPA: hypothetical protein VJ579_05185 [Candidatus Paceibacterota bacterium]|nr:hypothetical protein [Candidatus Paceibacterota bacterium]
MGKREGKTLGSFAELGDAFEGTPLPAEAVPAESVDEPTAETDDVAGDVVAFEDRRFIFNGYTEDGKARLIREYGGSSEPKVEEVHVSREQLLEGFHRAQKEDAAEEEKAEETKHQAQIAANTRIVQDVVTGTPEPVAVDNEIKRDIAAVEGVINAADAVPLPGNGEVAPNTLGETMEGGVLEGTLAGEDRKERAKELEKEAERALELEGEIAALRKKKGKKHEIGELYVERDKLDKHIYGVLREVAPEVLGSIKADDITRIDKMRELFGDEKNLAARRKKEQELITEGKISESDLVAYKEALGKRSGFIRSVTALGVPHHVATRLYRSEGEAVQEFGEITARAEAGDVKVLQTAKAKHLLSRFGIDEEGVQHFIESVEKGKGEEATAEFEAFVARGMPAPVEPAPEANAEVVPVSVAPEVAEHEVIPEVASNDEAAKEIARLEQRLKSTGFSSYAEMRAAKERIAALKAGVVAPPAIAAGITVNAVALPNTEESSPVVHEVQVMPPEISSEDVPLHIKTEQPVENAEVIIENEKPIISASIIEKFGNEGVSFEELQTIPGFTDLSEGQQLLMLKNYSTALVGKVKREAKKEADAAWGKRSFLGKVGLSMITMGLAKNVAEQTRQRDIARKLSSGDHLVASERKAMLEAFAKVAAEGPEVVKEEDGSLRMNYLSTERWKDDPEKLAVIEAYNAAASKFAKIPKQWLDADLAVPKGEQPGYFAKLLGHKHIALSGKEHLQVAETREEYQEARRGLLAALEKMDGKEGSPESRRAAMLELNGLDERVQLNQLFSSNPDAEEALQHIRDTNVFTRSISEFAKNRGQYMAYGAASRIAAAAVLGAVALPATAAIAGGAVAIGVAGAVGYFQSRREAKELLKTRRASGMIGDAELQEDVVYTANNEEILERKEAEREEALRSHDDERAQQLKADISVLREKIKSGNVLESRTRKLREFRDAKFYSDRVERLLTKLDVAHEMGDKESAEVLERKIAQTATLMREYMKQGMLSFGQESRIARINARAEDKHGVARSDDSRSAINGLAFMQALGHADAVHSLDMSAIETKIGSILEGYREDIDASARKRSNKHISKAVALRVGFGLAGFGLAHAASNFFGHGDGFAEGAGDAPKGTNWGEQALSRGPRPSVLPGSVAAHAEVALGAHTVVAGETLTSIVRKFPEVAKLAGHDQEVAIANLVKHLSPEKLKLMGISSGNANVIRVGEQIDLSKLHHQVTELKIGGGAGAHAETVAGQTVRAPRASVLPGEGEAPRMPRPSVLPGQTVHTQYGPPRPWVLPKDGDYAPTPKGEVVPEFAAAAQNKMQKSLEGIFGKKGIFGRDHTREWEGDPLRRVHGLKDTSAESLLTKRQGLIAESRTRMGLRDYMNSLRESSGIRPKTGETAELYIKRVLTEQERVLAHRAAGAEIVRNGERALDEAAAVRTRPLDESIKDYVDNNAQRVAEADKLRKAYTATRPGVEVVPHVETVHSTDEALAKLMPIMQKRFPELAKDGEGVQVNAYANFLRTAKPEHFKALGLDGEDMQKYVGNGTVDAEKIARYLKEHQHSGLHESVAAQPIPTGARAAAVVEEASTSPLSVSTAEIATLEKGWDALSIDEKSAAAERMIPQYIREQIAARVKIPNMDHFMEYLHRLPSNAVFAPKEVQLESMPQEYADALDAIKGIMLSKKIMNDNVMPNESVKLFDYMQQAYKGRMMYDGPSAVK